MKQIESVVLAFDGESRCGKTTVIEAVAKEANWQESRYREAVGPTGVLSGERLDLSDLAEFIDSNSFNRITTVSAGNAFRAAALHIALLGLKGETKECYTDEDSESIRELLRVDGIIDVLQSDPNIAAQVSTVGNIPGIQKVGGAIFSDFVKKAYFKGGGSNMVIVDARDPIGHLRRNGAIGQGEGQIIPASIMPVYIDTTAEVAARRMGGDYDQKLLEVKGRRHIDANHHENPVMRPPVLIDSFSEWLSQFPHPDTPDGIALPYRLNSHEGIGLDNVQFFAGVVATRAQDQGMWLHRQNAIA